MRHVQSCLTVICLLVLSSCATSKIYSSQAASRGQPVATGRQSLLLMPLNNLSERANAGQGVVDRLLQSLATVQVKASRAKTTVKGSAASDRIVLHAALQKKSAQRALVGSILEYGYRAGRAVIALSFRIYDVDRGDFIWGKNYSASDATLSFQAKPSLDDTLGEITARVVRDIAQLDKIR